MDVLPTLSDYLNIPDTLFSIGRSGFDTLDNSGAVHFIDGFYYFTRPPFTLIMRDGKSVGFFNLEKDPTLSDDLKGLGLPEEKKYLNQLLIWLADFNGRMIENKFH